MHREAHCWHSSNLGRDMHMTVYGHAGPPFLVFPVQDGMCDSYENAGMIDAMEDYLEQGRIRLFAVDSVDREGWSAIGQEPKQRVRTIEGYYHYICDEAMPRILEMTKGQLPITTGCSLGANHALNFFLRRPDLFGGCLCLSLAYGSEYFFGDYMDKTLYMNSPELYMQNLDPTHPYLAIYKERQMVLCIGQGPWEVGIDNQRFLERVFEEKGISCWFDYWGTDVSHDWPWWKLQMRYFLPYLLGDVRRDVRPANFIFVSPNYPYTYWQFADRLRRDGINVLGVGEAPYETLHDGLKDALSEYYRVDSLADYDQVFRAVAYLSFKHGKIDWIESLNEWWLELDARLRTDFNVTTGIQNDRIALIKQKSLMDHVYRQAKVLTARQCLVSTLDEAVDFVGEVGYPVIAKPDTGVGANATWKLVSPDQLVGFFAHLPQVPYVLEEFVCGELVSWDAILDSVCEPLFESMTVFPTPLMDVVNDDLDFHYYVSPEVPAKLSELGRRTSAAFGVNRRFVHLEFFRLSEDRPGLGNKGDYVGLEVNMRPPGGYTTDMMNYAHSLDVYQIYADMVAYDERRISGVGEDGFCVYASRKDGHSYTHTAQEVEERFADHIVMQEEMPAVNWPSMGRYMYTARFETIEEVTVFIDFVQS